MARSERSGSHESEGIGPLGFFAGSASDERSIVLVNEWVERCYVNFCRLEDRAP